MKFGTVGEALKATIALLVIFAVLACLGVPGLDIAFYLLIGWAKFLASVIPQMQIRWGLAASAAVYAAALIAGSQWFLRWLYRQMHGGAWQWRWTISGIALVVLMFSAGIGAVGVVHQTTWLVRSPAPIYRSGSERANRVRCASNLRQLGQGLMLYALDHGGKYPDDLRPLVITCEINPEVFVCPSSNDVKAVGKTIEEAAEGLLDPQRCSYIYLGKGLTNPVDPDRIVAVEKSDNHDYEGMNILYGDGHVEWSDKKVSDALLVKLGLGRVERDGATTRP